MNGIDRLSAVRGICAAVMCLLLLAAAVSDVRKRVIPPVCSRGLLLIALALLVFEKSYYQAAYFVLAVLATGGKMLKIPLFAAAVLTAANGGDGCIPFIFCLAAADLLFTLGIIGGGDAQILFSMLAFGWRSPDMAAVIAAVTTTGGMFAVVHRWGFRKAGRRMAEAARTLLAGNPAGDSERYRIPFACLLFISFPVYLFVSLTKS